MSHLDILAAHLPVGRKIKEQPAKKGEVKANKNAISIVAQAFQQPCDAGLG